MPPSDKDNKVSFLSSDSLSDDDSDPQQLQSPTYDEEDNVNDDAGSQVTMDKFDMAGTDFFMPGGVALFSVALQVKMAKLVLKDLLKTIKTSRISKKNFRVVTEVLNLGIDLLGKIAVSENSNARSIHNIAKQALKHGSKTLHDVVKKMSKLEKNLVTTRFKFLDVLEKMRKAVFERDAAIAKKKTASKTLKQELANAKKELGDVQKKMADTKKEVESTSRNTNRSTSRHNKTRGDSMQRLGEKKIIKLDSLSRRV
jgi:hypothetical protein